MNPSALTQSQPAVPVEYAEKAMGSLMKLHGELMEEKERRVDLYRRLMEKEQALAELKMYVKLLEEKLPSAGAAAKTANPAAVAAARPEPLRVVPPPAASSRSAVAAAPARGAVPRPPPRPTVRGESAKAAGARAHPRQLKSAPPRAEAAASPRRTADGWKSW